MERLRAIEFEKNYLEIATVCRDHLHIQKSFETSHRIGELAMERLCYGSLSLR